MRKWKNQISRYRLLCNMLKIKNFGSNWACPTAVRAHRLPEKEIAKIFVTAETWLIPRRNPPKKLWDVTRSYERIKSWIIYLLRYFGDHRSCEKGWCEERKEGPYSHDVVKRQLISRFLEVRNMQNPRKLDQYGWYKASGVLSFKVRKVEEPLADKAVKELNPSNSHSFLRSDSRRQWSFYKIWLN